MKLGTHVLYETMSGDRQFRKHRPRNNYTLPLGVINFYQHLAHYLTGVGEFRMPFSSREFRENRRSDTLLRTYTKFYTLSVTFSSHFNEIGTLTYFTYGGGGGGG